MKINEYQNLAIRTANEDKKAEWLDNGIFGLFGEGGELSDIVKKHKFQGHELNVEELKKELGDVCWYVALIASALDTDLESVMQGNIDKLKARYPDGFSVDASVNRSV